MASKWSKFVGTSSGIFGNIRKLSESHRKSSEVAGTFSEIRSMTRQEFHAFCVTVWNLAGIQDLLVRTKNSNRYFIQNHHCQHSISHKKFFVIIRYLFNCGEGTQRIFNEQKLKLSKLNNIFLTRICWEYVGGLPGMAMTLRDNGKSEIKLLGPSNLSDFIHATRFFLYHESLKFDCVGFTGSDGEEYKDENLTIWPVIINGRYDQPVP